MSTNPCAAGSQSLTRRPLARESHGVGEHVVEPGKHLGREAGHPVGPLGLHPPVHALALKPLEVADQLKVGAQDHRILVLFRPGMLDDPEPHVALSSQRQDLVDAAVVQVDMEIGDREIERLRGGGPGGGHRDRASKELAARNRTRIHHGSIALFPVCTFTNRG